jgi:hypothetical protein
MPLNKYATWGPLPPRPATAPGIARTVSFVPSLTKAFKASVSKGGKPAVGFGYHVLEEGMKVTYYVSLTPQELGTLVAEQLAADSSGTAGADFFAAVSRGLAGKKRRSKT